MGRPVQRAFTPLDLKLIEEHESPKAQQAPLLFSPGWVFKTTGVLPLAKGAPQTSLDANFNVQMRMHMHMMSKHDEPFHLR